MTAAELQRIRDRAAPDVRDMHSRQQLIARIRQHRKDVEALAAEVVRLGAVVERQAAELIERDLLAAETESLRRLVAAYEKRLEREWSPPRWKP